MAWVPWIETRGEETDDEETSRLFQRALSPRSGRIPDSIRLASLTPEVAGLIYDLSRAVHTSATGLSRREQEIAALIVSVYNGCVH